MPFNLLRGTSDRFHALLSLVKNPVVVRDLRAQMRGTKSYWFQGMYLLLLGILAIAGYAQATGQNLASAVGNTNSQGFNIVQAQGQMESLYYFIFMTLAALITLIGPALTASSIVGERQRLSLDLLLTTPLSAAELLVGKLVSSIAFLGLLLALSLPASALCILLGGATLADVFRVYVLLAVDGIVLAAIGLFFSCAARTNLLAIVWSYASVLVYLVVTGLLFALANPYDPTTQGFPTPLLSLAGLNPFVAVCPPLQQSFLVGSLPVPVWLGTVAAAVLGVRLLVTAATYRLGAYGGDSAPFLRRDVLLASGIVAFVAAQGYVSSQLAAGRNLQSSGQLNFYIGMICAFLVVILFLPALFTPASLEDTPPGATEESVSPEIINTPYRWRFAFRPYHPGALPYFHLWLLLTMGSTLAGFCVGQKALPGPEVRTAVVFVTLYLSGLGYLIWSVSRWAAVMTRGLSGARALTFGTFTLLAGFPVLALTLTTNGSWTTEPLAYLWIFNPLLQYNIGGLREATLFSGVISYGLGIGFLLLRRSMLRRRNFTAATVAPVA